MQFFSKLATLLSKKTSLCAANIFCAICDKRISYQDSSQLAFTCYKLIIETLENGVSSVSIVDFEQVYVCWVAEIGDSDEWVNIIFALNRVAIRIHPNTQDGAFCKNI